MRPVAVTTNGATATGVPISADTRLVAAIAIGGNAIITEDPTVTYAGWTANVGVFANLNVPVIANVWENFDVPILGGSVIFVASNAIGKATSFLFFQD